MTSYATLSEALTDIANRSFYESARVYKTVDGYSVEDWHTGVEEYQEWSYFYGLSNLGDWFDYSRVHASHEHYDGADHISYNLPNAVEAIEAGTPIGFTYVVAEELCNDEDEPDAHENSTCLNCYGGGTITVGWALVATNETFN